MSVPKLTASETPPPPVVKGIRSLCRGKTARSWC